MSTNKILRTHLVVFLLLFASTAAAQDEYVFTAPPRDVSGSDESAIYKPVADYLSAVTGKKIVYQDPNNWLSYQDKMRKGVYDLVFDGPHFISWRVAKIQHEPLAKLQGKLVFVVIAKKDNDKIASIKDMAGRQVCGLAPPNLATLTMYSLFDNPSRQPLVRQAKSFKEAYDDMMAGKCVAATMGKGFYTKFDKDQAVTKVLYTSPGVPNQGFSAGPRFSSQDKAKMADALVAPGARAKMAKFFENFSKEKDLVKVNRSEYEGVAVLLKDAYGFDLSLPSPKVETASGK